MTEQKETEDPYVLEKIVEKIKQAYKENFHEINGAKCAIIHKPRYNEHWYKIAKLCIELEADPAEFVTAAFKHSPNPKMLLPNMLYGEKARQWYAFEKHYDVKDIMHNVCETIKYKANKKNCSIRDIVLDKFEQLPPVVCYALFPDDEEVLAKYGNEAYEVLESRPDLKKALSDKNMFPSFSMEKLINYIEKN